MHADHIGDGEFVHKPRRWRRNRKPASAINITDVIAMVLASREPRRLDNQSSPGCNHALDRQGAGDAPVGESVILRNHAQQGGGDNETDEQDKGEYPGNHTPEMNPQHPKRKSAPVAGRGVTPRKITESDAQMADH